jgi:hypothetical protein
MSADEETPEQAVRRAAESDPSPYYADGRPKYHRHFAQYDIHTDETCDTSGAQRRVYVFDDDALDEHEAHIRADERAKAYDIVVAIAKAQRRS